MDAQILHELFEYRDGSLYWKVKSCRKVNVGSKAGRIDKYGYVLIGVNRKAYRAHRLIFLMFNGHLPEQVDHINGIRHDNRIENLRPATNSENQCNTKRNSKNTSGTKGVYFYKRYNCYRAECKTNGVSKHLGYFKTIEEAKEVLDKYRIEQHGEFANAG